MAVDGHTATYFWDAQVDDIAFLSLRTVGGQTAWLRKQHRMEEPVFFFSVSEASTLYLSNVSEASRFASFERKQKRAFLAKRHFATLQSSDASNFPGHSHLRYARCWPTILTDV